MRSKISILVLLLWGWNVSTAQLVVDNSITVEEAVQTLLGPGVDVFNITFSGGDTQRGIFNGENTTIGLESGLMLGSGDVSLGVGPNTGCCNSLGGGFFGATDPDLDQLDGLTHNDAVILEFDFVATGETMSFNYVWASEEYPEYSGAGNCGNVSDVFGFFVSGPGINGPFSNNAENIALIPGTTQFVSIFNLNGGCEGTAVPGDADCNYCEFYIHNGTGDGLPPFGTEPQYVQYDGYTVLLTATATLECGETYHVKLAVADVSDTAWDSAVFLEEGSFNISNSVISAFVPNPVPGQTNEQILEDCDVIGEFYINPPPCLDEAVTLNITYGGTATYGDDYTTNITGDIIIQPDEADTIVVIPVDDDLIEGIETITISIEYTNNEGNLDTAYATLNIIDYINMTVEPIGNLFICPGADAEATAVPIDGYGPFTYSWSSGGDDQTETYVAGQAGTYIVTVNDYCGSEAYAEFVVNEPPAWVPIDSVQACVGLNLSFNQFGGAMPYMYEFDTLQFNYIVDDDIFIPLSAGHYIVTVTDQCGQSAEVDIFAAVCDTQLPNVFTPNGDGENDYFEIFGIEAFDNSRLTVFNRWGTVVFESENYINNWNGADSPDGVYYYIFERSDGEKWEGHVHIIREVK